MPFHTPWGGVILVAAGVLLVLTFWGAVLLRALAPLRLGRSTVARRSEDLLYGMLAFSAAGFIGVRLRVPLDTTFAAGTVVIAAVGAWLHRHRIRQMANGLPSTIVRRLAPGRDGWLLAAVVAASLLWSVTNIRGLEPSASGLALVPWADFFFHARTLALFSQFDGTAGRLHWTLAGEPMEVYHYGSYIVPALVARLGGLPSIQVATSLYPVLGMLLTGLAMLVLTRDRQGRGGAATAVVLLFLVPDLSGWVPGLTRFNSYFFFQQVGVGGAYAVAVMGLALACALEGQRRRSRVLWVAAAGLFCVAALFKATIFLAHGAFFFVFLCLTAGWLPLRARLLLAVVSLASFAALITTLEQLPGAPTLDISLDQVRRYFTRLPDFVQRQTAPAWFVAGVLLPAAALGVLAATLGVLLPVLAGLMWLCRKDAAVRTTIVLGVLALVATVSVRLLVADNQSSSGDVAEINRKTFVWPYFVVVYCTATLLWHVVRQRGWALAGATRKAGLSAALVLLILFCGAAAHRVQDMENLGDALRHVAIPAGLADTARHLRAATAPRDVVQLCENDIFNQLSVLSERAAYVSHVVINAAPATAVEQARFDTLRRIVASADAAPAMALAGRAGIDWLVLTPNCRPRWEAGLTPTLVSAGYRLFSTGP